MRASVPLCLLVAAMFLAGDPALAKKPLSSPAVVVVSVDADGNCHVSPKKLWIVAKDAVGVKGPKKVRFFYARGDSDKSKVKMTADPNQKHPKILDLPQIGDTQSMGDSSESKETFDGVEYKFTYSVEVETDDETITCDPDICIKKGDGTCSGY